MVSPVREEGYAITCSQLFKLILKEISPGNSSEMVYIANTVYIRVIWFSEFIRPTTRLR